METWSSSLGLSPTGFGRGRCQCAKGTQDIESSISNDTLKPDGVLITSANKETKENFIQFSEVPTHVTLMNGWRMTLLRLLHGHVILMNDLAKLAKLHVVCFSKWFFPNKLGSSRLQSPWLQHSCETHGFFPEGWKVEETIDTYETIVFRIAFRKFYGGKKM